ncbi:unnamed protein product [Parnassius apollo]|uniref:L-serine deaminase n=1 Tax=Parnassius apollo TaxID=110799 RepID=A0A8S3WCK1_PARAO|nr:unnamed protein product [Parnassius apollo]
MTKCGNFGVKPVLHGDNISEAKLYAMTLGKEKKMMYINGYDHPNIIEGQGIAGVEILEQIPDVDAIIIPVGGGSLIAGVCAFSKHLKPNVEIYGVETDLTCSMVESLRKNERIYFPIDSTIADGLAVNKVGVNTFHTIKGLVDKMVVVKEDWVARAVMHIVEQERFVVEGSGAVSVAAVIAGLFPNLKGKKVVCILTGGNIDTTILARALERGMAAEGRLVKFKVTVSDRPGGMADLCYLMANCGVTLRDCIPERAWVKGDVFRCELKVIAETRGWDHTRELMDIIKKNYKEYYFPDFDEQPEKSTARRGPCLAPNPICMQNFKERGAFYSLSKLRTEQKEIGVITASLGNWAMILIDDDWIAKALLHLVEDEKFIAEGAAAAPLASLMALPRALIELKDKTVVCVLSGGNLEPILIRSLERAQALEGRIITVNVTLPGLEISNLQKIFNIIAKLGCNVIRHTVEESWGVESYMNDINEDFDELCDPENPKKIKYEDVVDAASRSRPLITVTPCYESQPQNAFGMKLYYKLEFVLKTGSFKERGALNVLQMLPQDKKKIGVVLASMGNQAIGICYYGGKLHIPVVVVMPKGVPLIKLQICKNFGAKVIVEGNDLQESQKHARAIARDKGLTFINGRDHPHVLIGYGGVALEILEQVPTVDAVIVPVGTGGLVAAVATVIKHSKPNCLVYMLVEEDWIARAVLHLVEKERFVVEGAGACTVAAILSSLVPELKTKK